MKSPIQNLVICVALIIMCHSISAQTLVLLATNGPALLTPTTLAGLSIVKTIAVSNSPVATAGDSETNLLFYRIPGIYLTNNGDRIEFTASFFYAGNVQAKAANAYLSGQAIYISGSSALYSGAAMLNGEIIRTGPNSAMVNTWMNHTSAGTTVATSFSQNITVDHGTNSILQMRAVGNSTGGEFVTNRTLVVKYWPAP